jgi:uncharacterized membrane protein YgcG
MWAAATRLIPAMLHHELARVYAAFPFNPQAQSGGGGDGGGGSGSGSGSGSGGSGDGRISLQEACATRCA